LKAGTVLLNIGADRTLIHSPLLILMHSRLIDLKHSKPGAHNSLACTYFIIS